VKLVRTQLDELVRAVMETVNDHDLKLTYLEAAYESGTLTIKVGEGL
jgi:hypothetical protein